MGKYIYDIIPTGEERSFDICGLGGSTVYTIAYQDLGCVLSDYQDKELGSMSKEEIIRSLFAAQRVVEHIMKEHTVLPAKFGTILASANEVRELLSQGYRQFIEVLARVDGKVEMEIAVTWDIGQVLRDIGAEPEILRLKEELSGKPGGPTLEERIHLGQMVKAALDRRRADCQSKIIDFLKPVAVDVQPNALLSDELVANIAFLVDRGRQKEFDDRVERLNELFLDQLNFRIIGPLPPYSFAMVEVVRVGREKLEEARRLLGLGEGFSEPEVRRAYRRLASLVHPDKKPDNEARLWFIKLRQARELLISCLRGQVTPGGLAVKIKRQVGDERRYPHLAEIGMRNG